MSGRKPLKITPKKNSKLPSGGRSPPKRAQPSGPKSGPPSRSQPSGPKKKNGIAPKQGGGGADSVVARLQELIQQKDTKIEKLTERINTLSMENKTLQRKVENLQKSAAPPKKKKAAAGGGIETGMSQGAAKNALGAMFAKKGGGLNSHLKNKKAAEEKDSGGVSGGMSQGAAKNALAGLFAGRGGGGAAPKKKDEGGVSGGMSQGAAKNALGAMFAKKAGGGPPKKKSGGGGGGGGADQYKQLFKKYEMMMKLGINVHGAVGRMRQDGVDKAAIAAFEKKHNAYGDEEDEKIDPKSLGLREKREVPVGKGIKMKRLHWDPTNLKLVKGSIWEDLDETQIRYDKKHFELHFQVRQRKPVEEQKQAQKIEAGTIITFVSKKRTQAVLIGLKNLNLDNEQLRRVLHNMDEKIMTVDTLSKLLEMAPTMDEQTEAEKKIMQEGTRRVKDYGTVEQFFFTLCDFYNLHQRLKLWMFKQNFHEICDSLLDQYKTIGKACDKMRNNKNLKLLLTIIMAFGNHMNSGTRKGCVYGFDLKILTGMTGVKSFDNTRSLLMYIYEFCDRKYPNAIKVLPELMDTLKSASSMEVETLKQAYQRIQDNMQEIKNLITSDEIENYDLDDRFIMVLTKFHKAASPKMKKFNMTVGNVMVSTKRVMKKFSYGSEDDPKTIESFFQIWWKFMQDFSASKEKLIQLEKERQKRIAKRRKAKEKEKRKQAQKQYGKQLPSGPKDDEPELNKSGSLYREFEKRKKFDQKKGALHGKLRGHVKQRSIFITNGGKLDGNQPQNETMRRLSSMYQNDQAQVKAMEEARKKAAILKYNKFRLPSQPNRKISNFDTQKPFNIPDSVQFSAPGGNARGGGGGGGIRAPPQNSRNAGKNGHNARSNGAVKNGHNGRALPQKQQPNRFVNGGGKAYNNGGGNYNPQANWQQQAMQYNDSMQFINQQNGANGVPPPPKQQAPQRQQGGYKYTGGIGRGNGWKQ